MIKVEKRDSSLGGDFPATSFVLDNQLSRVNNLLSCCIPNLLDFFRFVEKRQITLGLIVEISLMIEEQRHMNH